MPADMTSTDRPGDGGATRYDPDRSGSANTQVDIGAARAALRHGDHPSEG